jgi:hypothetical protein
MDVASTARILARAAVVSAFADTTYPGDDLIARCDNAKWTAIYGQDYEGAEVFRLFQGKRWQDIDLAYMRHPLGGFHQGFTAFLADEALGYYAPALMLIALDNGSEADIYLYDAVDIFGADFGSSRSFERRVGGFAKEQRAAVAAFLQVMADEDFGWDPESNARKLLAKGWGAFL